MKIAISHHFVAPARLRVNKEISQGVFTNSALENLVKVKKKKKYWTLQYITMSVTFIILRQILLDKAHHPDVA